MLTNVKVPILNASGCWSSNEEQLDELFNSELGGIVTKTCTLLEKEGNSEPTYFKTKDNVHINSKGLPNPGYEYYKKLYKKYSDNEKQFILSIAYYKDMSDILKLLLDYDSFVIKNELVEINLSCPNIEKDICSYNLKLLEELLVNLRSLQLNKIYISLKLSPYLDYKLCDGVIKLINKYGEKIRYLVLSNSIPNGLILSDGKPVISNIYGGLSGRLNKYIALSNVHYFKGKVNSNIKLIGCGGIESIDDVMDYLNNGADLVELGSSFYDEENNKLNINKMNSLIMTYKKRKI